jgi:hypothetical protein
MKLSDINIYDVGNKWGLMGAIFGDEDGVLLCMLPDTTVPPPKMDFLEMNDEDWHKFLRQSDLLEGEVLSKTKDGKLAKAIMRKTQRVIESRVSWAVYKRDGYKCRYCGRDGVPLTVDHVICWEVGGPSVPANLVAACRKCNKVRANTPYEEWLKHPYYLDKSHGLTQGIKKKNQDLVETLGSIPRSVPGRKARK